MTALFKPMSEIPMSIDAADNLAQARALLVTFPDGLHPDSKRLVQEFAEQMGQKLRDAELKYGRTDGWLRHDWEHECHKQLADHMAKGDPRDVAIYCAFMWARGWSTNPPRKLRRPAKTAR